MPVFAFILRFLLPLFQADNSGIVQYAGLIAIPGFPEIMKIVCFRHLNVFLKEKPQSTFTLSKQ